MASGPPHSGFRPRKGSTVRRNDNYFRKWRRDLIEFLERAVKFGEPIWCCLRRADPHHS